MLKPNATGRPGQRIEDTITAILEEDPNQEELLLQKLKKVKFIISRMDKFFPQS